jgi:hypothetical protein
MKTRDRLVAIVLAWSLSLSASAAVQAWLDRNQVTSGESVELTLQRDGSSGGGPDLSPLGRDFDILGRSSGSSIQIVNGSMTAQTQVRLTLAPKHDGHIRIPPLQWGGEQTPALDLTVEGAVGQGAGNGPGPAAAPSSHVFLTSSVDQKRPYVQGATTLTVRLYTDEPLYQASLDLPPNDDVMVQPLGKDKKSTQMIDGRPYRVIERDYLLFPQRSGSIRLAGPVLDAQVPDESTPGPFAGDPFFSGAFRNFFNGNPFAGMMTTMRPLRLHGKPIRLHVRPRPAASSGRNWLPAQRMALTESWGAGQVQAGEPITRHLHLSALGLTADQLPDLSTLMPLPPGVNAYPDQPKLNTGVQDGTVEGTRDQDIALIASRPGHFRLPAMHLYWWDTTRNLQREISLPAHVLDVVPGAAGSTGAAPSPLPAPVSLPLAGTRRRAASSPFAAIASAPWPWISLALVVLWLGTMAAWWRFRRKGSIPPASVAVPAASGSPSSGTAPGVHNARKAFLQSCGTGDAPAARRHLLAWACATWPDDPPTGVNALALRLGRPELAPLLRRLDRACYAGGDWDGGPLADALTSLSTPKPTAGATQALAGLYP